MTSVDTETALGPPPVGYWSPEARDLINFVYQFWAHNRRPPNFLDIHAATGLSPRQTRRLFRELQDGFGLIAQDNIIGLSIAKAPPFSATPTTTAAFLDGAFLSYVGCPMEVFTVGRLPPLEDKVLTARSYCACCATPIELEIQGQDIRSVSPSRPLISVVRTPYENAGGVTPDIVCDGFHFVLDEEHADRFERQIARRGTTMTLEQAVQLTSDIGNRRMRDQHFALRLEAEPMISFLESIGVDVSVWQA